MPSRIVISYHKPLGRIFQLKIDRRAQDNPIGAEHLFDVLVGGVIFDGTTVFFVDEEGGLLAIMRHK